MKNNIILLDNFDSFTYNIVDQLRVYGHNVIIYRNKVSLNIILHKLSKLKNPIVLLSPGPGIPKHSGCMMELLSKIIGKVPIIGICLGHQAIVQFYGGKIDYAQDIVHGKSSLIHHDEKYMFTGIPNPFWAARYHSLVCKDIPSSLIVNAYINEIVMGIRNNYDRVCSFQFHPESILTTFGAQLLLNTLIWVRE